MSERMGSGEERLKQAFFAICEAPRERRAELLDRYAATDASMRAELEILLAADEAPVGASSFLDKSAFALAAGAGSASPLITPGAMLGEFRIVRAIGEGGMGVVFEATQDHPKRTVALKVIAESFASPSLIERFRREADLLARLNHPGIAQVYAAGVATTSIVGGIERTQPYLAMELVDGEPLTGYATRVGLNVNGILELMALICGAVQHAHERGVIHRDLKPANILVDRTGRPKVLDFGVGRASSADAQNMTLQTNPGQLIGTLPYMSPEQAAGDPAKVDARCDVYALGVLLFELLAGRLPLDLSNRSVADAIGVIQTVEPMRLGAIDRRLRGDIETIVEKSLQKAPHERYRSAAALADDIRRYLRSELIEARPASLAYRIRKFAARRRSLFAALCVGATSVAVGVGFLVTGLVRANQERDRAVDALRTSESVVQFFGESLRSARAEYSGQQATRADLLAAAARRLETELRDQPVARIVICNAIGDAYGSILEFEKAEPLLKEALSLAEALPQRPDLALTVTHNLGGMYQRQRRTAEAERLLTRALELSRQLHGNEHAETAHILNVLADVFRSTGRLDQAAAMCAEALAVQTRLLPADHESVLATRFNTAAIERAGGRFEQAEAIHRELLELYVRKYPPDGGHNGAIVCDKLAELCMLRQRYAEAEPFFRRAVQGFLRTLGPRADLTRHTSKNLSAALLKLDRLDEAADLLRADLAIEREEWGPRDLRTVSSLKRLGQYYMAGRRFNEALAPFEEAAELLRTDAPNQQCALASVLVLCGRAKIRLDEYDVAEALLKEARSLSTSTTETCDATSIAVELAALYDASGKPELAAEWRARASQSTPAGQRQ